MAKITIVGAGITGMSIASVLSRSHDVMIVARNLPGDKATIDWASPWAGASFIPGGCSSVDERKMQRDTFAELWRLSISHPESGVKQVFAEDFHDDKTEDDIWWKSYMPQFQFLPQHSLPKGAKIGTRYKTVILNPDVFLPWFKTELERTGVRFKRMELKSLSEARSLGHDILINATGLGSLTLHDVRDQNMQMIRGQTALVKSNLKELLMHDNGEVYTYAIPRLDGTVILGGTRDIHPVSPDVDSDQVNDIFKRINSHLPEHFSANPSDHEIVRHNVGIRPYRLGGVRVDTEEVNGQKIVHAYGVVGGGYIFGFGVARIARDLIDEFLFPSPKPRI